MIKRLLTTGLVLAGMMAMNAQQKAVVKDSEISQISKILSQTMNANKNSSLPPFPDGDTLGYFQNKHFARNTGTTAQSYYTVKSPYVQSGTVQPVISEFGSSFLNPGNATITVYGAYALALRHAASTSTSIPIKVYIYSASPSGVPGVKLDSAMTTVVQSTIGTYCPATFSNPVTVTGAFFMSARPMGLNTDTIRYFINNAYSQSGTLTPTSQRYGEGLSYTRYNGNLTTNMNFYGSGTEYENVIIPMVAFSYSAGATAPPTNTTSPTGYCANLAVTFSSTSTPASVLENRQFNFNAFANAWMPFVNTQSATPTAMRQADKIYNWAFSTGTVATNVSVNTSTASVTFPTSGATNGNLIVKYQHSSPFGKTSKTQQATTPAMSFTVVNCGIVGLSQNFMEMTEVSVFPNPAINGKTTIQGLEGKNTITVYNLIGQAVSSMVTENEVEMIDLNAQPAGTYVIRVTDSINRSKSIKVIKD